MTQQLVFNFLETLIGFSLALFLNTLADIYWRDPREHKKILRAIKLEALTNCNICVESFWELHEEGIVLNQYSLETIEKNISNHTFIVNTDPEEVIILIRYLKVLKLCNKYPEFIMNLRLDHDIKNNHWLHKAPGIWWKQIQDSALSIREVIEILKEKDIQFNNILQKDKRTLHNFSILVTKIEKGIKFKDK